MVLKLIVAALLLLPQLALGQKLEQIVAEAKKEGEVTLMASTSTFGGKKGFAELETAFAKRYGFKAKLNLSGGPSFPQMAARIITEQKAGTKSSTDLYLGSDGTYMTMHLEKALQKVNWSGTFPWVTKEMEIFPQESVLVYASFHGIIYNSNAIPKDKAPKNYEDLIDPALSPTWAGKMAIPAYIHWLIRVSPIWGREKMLSLRAQIGAAGRWAAAPRRRGAHRQRRVSDHGEHRRPARSDVEVAGQRRASGRLAGFDAGDLFLLSIVGAEKFGSSEHGQTLRRVHGDPRGAKRAGKARLSKLSSSRRNYLGEIREGQQAQDARSERAQRGVSKRRFCAGRRVN